MEEHFDENILEFHPSYATSAVENANEAILNSYRLNGPYQKKSLRFTIKPNMDKGQFTFEKGTEKFEQLKKCQQLVKKYNNKM
jgi:hypothetical protein